MSDDDNPLAGIGEELEAAEGGTENGASSPDPKTKTSDEVSDEETARDDGTTAEAGTGDDTDTGRDEDRTEEDETDTDTEAADPHREPAFPFSPDMQRPIYPPQDTWENWEDVRDFEVLRRLRDGGVRNVPKRELHAAILEVAMDDPEAVAEAVMRGRGIDDG